MSVPLETGDELRGRILLITGAAGSLGSVAAKACAAQGAQTILLDKSVKGLELLYDEIVSHGHPRPALYPFDFAGATETDYEELAQTLEREFGALHGLLHSAVELGVLGPLTDMDGFSLERALRINLTGPHLLTRALLPLLSRTGDAALVFTGDSSASRRQAYWGAYGIAKAALENLALVLAQELEATGRIRVNIFEPGPVNSALRLKTHPGERADQRLDPVLLAGRYLQLLGPAGCGTTGAVIRGPLPEHSIENPTHMENEPNVRS